MTTKVYDRVQQKFIDALPLIADEFEALVNKVSAWSPTPNDAHYPSEKLVKTSLDAISAAIPTTHYEALVFKDFNEDVVYLNGSNKVPNFVTNAGDIYYGKV